MRTKAIHIIWSTYGSWLPGDPRGHWSALMDIWGTYPGGRHALQKGDPNTHRRARHLLKSSEVILSDHEQILVANTIHDALDDHPIHALAIERTHVHLLIAPIFTSISQLTGQLKGRTSSAVLKSRANRTVRRIWSHGFWTKFPTCERGISAVQNYIQSHNVRRGLLASPWRCLRPCGITPTPGKPGASYPELAQIDLRL